MRRNRWTRPQRQHCRQMSGRQSPLAPCRGRLNTGWSMSRAIPATERGSLRTSRNRRSFARASVPALLGGRRPIFAGHTLIGPQNQSEAMSFDQFAGKLIDHPRLDPIDGVARPEPRLGAPLDLVHCRAVKKNLGQPAQTFAEPHLLVEAISEARVPRCGGQRPELDGTERVDQELLVMRLLGPEDCEKRRAVTTRSGQPVPHDLGARLGQPETFDDLVALALVIGAEHETPGRLRNDAVAHIGEALAGKPELDVVLAALADVELGLGAHERAALGAVPLVVIDALDGLVDLGESLAVIGLYAIRDEGEVFGVQEEVAREDVPRE